MENLGNLDVASRALFLEQFPCILDYLSKPIIRVNSLENSFPLQVRAGPYPGKRASGRGVSWEIMRLWLLLLSQLSSVPGQNLSALAAFTMPANMLMCVRRWKKNLLSFPDLIH